MEEPRRLGGRYELGGVLGRGGMAEVYLAHDSRLGRSVAVKTLRADMARDPSFQARFRREAQSAASLNHPAIVAVYDTGEDYIDGISIPYIVMEYVEGSTLRELLHSGRRLLPERALEMTIGILQALEYSHRAGIVHRDIKPANVMLTRQGNVKVMDFGIARAMGDAGMTMTQTSAVIGTAQYLSPEQAKGEQVDARSDIYSTGCLLYELLAVRPPFVGDSPVAVAYQHVREEALPPSTYDPELRPEIDAIVLKALTKDRDYRYQSADEMRDDIERFLDGLPVAAAQQAAAYGMGAQGYGYDQQGYPAQHDPYGQTNLLPQQGPAGATTMLPQVGGPQQGYGYQDTGYPDNGGGYDDGYDRGGRRQDSPKKNNTSWIILAVAAVLVLVGAYFVVAAMTKTGGGAAGKVSVPNLVGKTLTDAQAAAKAQNAKLQAAQVDQIPCPDATIKVGQVCTQEPAAGLLIAPDGTIKLHIAAAPTSSAVPDVRGKSSSDAATAITAAGFTVGNTTYQASDTVPQDSVISTDPSGTAAPGTAINLVVSSGQGKTPVPNVIGQQQDAATQALSDAGFNAVPKTQTVTDQTKDGVVIDQSPKSGSLKKGANVTITVGKMAQNATVPPLQNVTLKEAIKQLQGLGLNYTLGPLSPPDPNSIVMYSTPAAGSQQPPGTVITLFTRAADKTPGQGPGSPPPGQ
ncbi:Stk1 family PASTA domain-containing Ser/Thr kinase [Kitasatospora sp. MAP5-34]|uniref:Stk1 family PASTA domain-containing Ser/Thr kinase n=1 Tax=Kitasatospora sp. MAP5-34 TaxID=3035102 RepID=UPI00247374B4|nr:Stk1 family PASTA domain-containing Ser/Thr kinase [Kitasatospora sp. MAP5-34]MDH6576415.1 beta-lactam-binding protein with PASTA domain/tRNA A-37 threonylcarbamoyl transferase component Bud32 [Kitasatospora sp. MAP5-34]